MSYRPDIQGLRAVAVLAFMLFHLNPAWLPGGFVGVDVFLVISGFLIVRTLLHKKAQPDYRLASTLNYFYNSRFKRIVPAYFGMLIVVSLVAAVLFLPQDLYIYKEGLAKATWFNSNNYFADFGDYFAPANHEQPLLHTWSLAIELQFYLLAPFIVLLLPLKALKWVLGALLIGLTAAAEYRLRLGIEQATYYSLYARLPEFFVGGLVALYFYKKRGGEKKRPWLSTIGLALVFTAAAAQPSFGHFPGLPALLPVLGAALIILHPSQGLTQQLLVNKPMTWIGELSYSLYLWHWPVLAFLRYYTGAEVLTALFSLLFIVLTLLLAILSFYWIEAPLRAKHTRVKQALGYVVLACLALGTSKGMATINQTLTPAPLPVEYQRYADPKTICHGQIVGDCLKGDLSSEKEVLVLGDSHAAMLNHFFDYVDKELGFKARIITGSGCVTIPGFDYQRIAEWAHKACKDQIEVTESYLSSSSIVILAGSWSGHTQSEGFNKALDRFLKSHSKQKIYVFSQVPKFDGNIVRAHRFEVLGFFPEVNRELTYQMANEKMVELVRQHSNAKFLALDKVGVFKSAPLYEGKLIYSDHHHLNEIGAYIYAVDALDYLRPILATH